MHGTTAIAYNSSKQWPVTIAGMRPVLPTHAEVMEPNSSRSAGTSVSAFSWTIRDAEVCRHQTVEQARPGAGQTVNWPVAMPCCPTQARIGCVTSCSP
jgi:hypothetical protein